MSSSRHHLTTDMPCVAFLIMPHDALDSFELFVSMVLAPKSKPSLSAISNRRCNLGVCHVNSLINFYVWPLVLWLLTWLQSNPHIGALPSGVMNRRFHSDFSNRLNLRPLIFHMWRHHYHVSATCNLLNNATCHPFLACCEPWNCWICMPHVNPFGTSSWHQPPCVTCRNQFLHATHPVATRNIDTFKMCPLPGNFCLRANAMFYWIIFHTSRGFGYWKE